MPHTSWGEGSSARLSYQRNLENCWPTSDISPGALKYAEWKNLENEGRTRVLRSLSLQRYKFQNPSDKYDIDFLYFLTRHSFQNS